MNGYKNDTIIFKALCDEKRLSILELLKGGEKCACVLMEELNIAQSALSYHMKILCESGPARLSLPSFPPLVSRYAALPVPEVLSYAPASNPSSFHRNR